ncbi:MAG: penicillin-binding transpeptidase domain-containing protein [Deltaproteobacteria bacterium]|nr:penicillin-binding transpeptidase domain-containing protein [Deltaproteobacteria bacterium]
MRLALPLCLGLGVAVVVDAVLPAAALAQPPAPVVAAAVVVAPPVVPATAVVAEPAAPVVVVAAPPPRSTRDEELQARIRRLLENGKTPFGAVVVMEAHTGRIIATAEHSTRGPAAGLATRPMAPAASIFKIVTSSALLEQGVPLSERVCFHGGKTRMREENLNDSKRDNNCVRFDDVVPMSANVAVAKLARKHLTPALLQTQAARWGFGRSTSSLSGEVPSTATIPASPFEFATTAAGFGNVQLSALQGATIAGIVANDGVLVPARDVVGGDVAFERVISASNARALRRMMTDTVTHGTGRKAFSARPLLPVSAAGKTGSLTDYKTGLDTSWFIGFAPADAPELIVAAVVVNTSKWHIKAPWLAKESLRLALRDHGPARPAARVAAR